MPTPLETLTSRHDGLQGRRVAVLGYGNQGTAHALNLRDDGTDVVVGQRNGSAGWARAEADGFAPRPLADAARDADLVIMALPDLAHAKVWPTIARHIAHDAVIGFLHGFSVHYGLITLPATVGVVLVAPKGPGTTLRERYRDGAGLPCLFAVHQESPSGRARELGLAWAAGIGGSRAAIVPTTFAAETETDLFGEQVVLCGGLAGLIRAAFETLVEAGYPPELAYLECGQEVKQIADLVYGEGLAETMRRISDTAEFGAYEAAERIVDPAVRTKMREILEDIRRGDFARRLVADDAAGGTRMRAARAAAAAHPVESAASTVRGWWDGRPTSGESADGVMRTTP